MGAWRGQIGAACQSISSPAALRSEHSSAPSALIVADRVPFDSVCRSIIAKLPNSLRDRGVDVAVFTWPPCRTIVLAEAESTPLPDDACSANQVVGPALR